MNFLLASSYKWCSNVVKDCRVTAMTANKTDKKETYIYQSNAMINAFYHCSVTEKRLLNLGISKVDVDADSWEALQVTISVEEYMQMYSGSARLSNIKKDIIEAAEKLQTRQILFNDRDETVYENIVWQRRLNMSKEGYIKMSFTPNVARELTKLFHVGDFTAYTIEDTKDLTSFAAYRLYELGMQFVKRDGIGEVYKIPLENMRIILLGEGNDKYKSTANFNSGVVQRAAKQINEKTNMMIEVTPLKKNNGVTKHGSPIQGFNLKVEVKNPAILLGRKSEEKPQEKPQEKPAPEVENHYEPADYADYIDGEIVQPKPVNQEETAMSRSEKIAAQVAARQAEIEARGGLKIPPKESNADFLGGIEKSLREAAALAAANGSVDDLERALRMLKTLESDKTTDAPVTPDEKPLTAAEYAAALKNPKPEAKAEPEDDDIELSEEEIRKFAKLWAGMKKSAKD